MQKYFTGCLNSSKNKGISSGEKETKIGKDACKMISHKVTVVIPVYSDWSSLHQCIESLKQNLDSQHIVLLINDKGPEWETLEHLIQESISGFDNFKYYCNPHNMGFVKTCNRAVFELDKTGNDILLLNSDTEVTEGFLEEMLDVLYGAEKHGVVCPRSNNATILTIPARTNGGKMPTAEQSYKTFCAVKKLLPRQTVIPTGVGFAFLTKRKLIDSYGLFDETYSPGYNEENDYCMRINRYGYSVLMANRAFVYHNGAISFRKHRNQLEEKHRKILLSRYPYYNELVEHYQRIAQDPVDYFADLIGDAIYEKPRILLDLYECPAAHNGTAQHCLYVVKYFNKIYSDKYEIFILIQRDTDQKFRISEMYSNVIFPDTIQETFHICYSPSQIFWDEHLRLLNRHCLKIVVCMQDIISVRSQYLLARYGFEREDIFRRTIHYADGIIYISRFAKEDTLDYYADHLPGKPPYSQVVYEAASVEKSMLGCTTEETLPFEDYFAVIGNQYAHKYLNEILHSLMDSKYNFIVIGTEQTEKLQSNLYGYQSGALSDELVEQIFQNSQGIIFPSVYEGFGLPIVNAIQYRKKILVNDNPLNREQKEALDYYSDNIYLFGSVNEIETKLDAMHKDPFTPVPQLAERTWDEVVTDVECVLKHILEDGIDVAHLRSRWRELNYEAIRAPGEVQIGWKEYIKKFAFQWPEPQGKGIKPALKRMLRRLIRGMNKIRHALKS